MHNYSDRTCEIAYKNLRLGSAEDASGHQVEACGEPALSEAIIQQQQHCVTAPRLKMAALAAVRRTRNSRNSALAITLHQNPDFAIFKGGGRKWLSA